MRRIQIQIPEELHQKVQAFAKEQGWSLAETLQRGAELLLQIYPESPQTAATAWSPPTSGKVGWKGLTPVQLRDTAFIDGDPRMG